MSKGANQRLKLIYLAKIMLEKTDEHHGLKMKEILSELEAYGVSADRKTIPNDFDILRTFGIDVKQERQGRDFSYKVVGRQF